MSSAAKLYTPQVLALATSLADWPLDAGLELSGDARSAVCGSSITLGLSLANDGTIVGLGVKSHACAIGQAAAGLFARAATGRNRAEIETAFAALQRWLEDGAAPPPAWPGIDLLDAARAYPARHGAILLPWKAALAALPSTAEPG